MNNTALQIRQTDASAELAEVAPDRQLEAIKRMLSQRTPSSEIRVREGRGGQKLKYTDGAYVIRTLNEALGWDWDFVADNEELLMNGDRPFEIKVRGTLTVRMNGRTVTKTQYGCQPIEMKRDGTAPVSIGDCYKGAATDALKKCASLLGIALDLYDSDYKAEKYAEPGETEPVKPALVSKPRPTKAPAPIQDAQLGNNTPSVTATEFWKSVRKWKVPEKESSDYAQAAINNEITWAEALNTLREMYG
jgi:hypothetical protein